MAIVETTLFIYFSAVALYTLILSVAGRFHRLPKFPKTNETKRIALFVPCYKEDNVIVNVARQLSQLQYPKEAFDVIVIADSLQEKTLSALRQLSIITLPVHFDKSTKTKSLNEAFKNLPEGKYDIAIINDADNIPQPDFLVRINEAFCAGYKIIQTQRVAKNLNTRFAILDAASEMINNHLFRKGANALGLSSSIIGSGMAYPYNLLKAELSKIDATGGFDKVLQLNVLEQGYKILYLEGTLIFDEKIESSEAFQKQRKRWLSSQFVYFRKFFLKGFYMLGKGNVDFFNLSVVYNLFPPRIIALGMMVLLTSLFSIVHWPDLLSMAKWWIVLGIYLGSLALALPAKFYNRQFLIAILDLPLALWQVIKVMFGLKGADRKFIHTTHTQLEVDNPLFNKESK